MAETDLVIIGAGPGGYTAALLAARKGMKVTLVEKEKVGGTCLQIGCIPSKILLDAVRRRDQFSMLNSLLDDKNLIPEFDYSKLISHARKQVETITSGLQHLLKRAGVVLIYGKAHFTSAKEITVATDIQKSQQISADHIIIACGGHARTLPSISYPDEHARILTPEDALTAPSKPQSIVIIGGGPIGCEFATFFRALGINVTIVEALARLLPLEDQDISRELQACFREQGINAITNAFINETETTPHEATFTLNDGKKLNASHGLLAVGIIPATEPLLLEHAGILVNEKGFIPVSLPSYETAAKHVYAIGDAIAIPQKTHPGLAHVASAEAEQVIRAITGEAVTPIDYDNIPVCTFTNPEVAHVGLSDEQARNQTCPHPNHKIHSARVSYGALGRAIALGHSDGFIKIVEHRDTFRSRPLRSIAGAHIIGEGAAEIIHVFAQARHAEDSIDHMKSLVFQHPTWSELIGEALRALDGDAIHVITRRGKNDGRTTS